MATTSGSEVAARMGKAINSNITAKVKSEFPGGVRAKAHEESSVAFSLTISSSQIFGEEQKAVLKDFVLSDAIRAVIQAQIKEIGWRAFRLRSRPVPTMHPSKEYVWLIIKK